MSTVTSRESSAAIDPNSLLRALRSRQTAVAVVGLGYVGLPLAVALARKFRVVGYDVSPERIDLLRRGIDPSEEVEKDALESVEIDFTAEPETLRSASIVIVAVPTPVNADKTPDLAPLEAASRAVGRHLAPGAIVCFESTVYPGATEEVCGPAIERESGLVCGRDFFLAYSPERINPGDRERTIDRIVKIVSGQTDGVRDVVAAVYGEVVTAGIHVASSIKVAEAAKVIENAQRDINIAFVNELAIIFDKMGIDTKEVLEAAGTKWNFLNFRPGLVGGHCIGVDPYYLTYKAQTLGHIPQTILSGRRINDGMGRWIGRKLVKALIETDRNVKGARVLVCGLTFKENVSDVRNSRVKDILDELRDYHVAVSAFDPYVSADVAAEHFDVPLVEKSALHGFDAVVFAVAHDELREWSVERVAGIVNRQPAPLFDLKWLFAREDAERAGFRYWRL